MEQTSKSSLADALPIGLVELDAEGRILTANSIAEELLGSTADALRGTIWTEALGVPHSTVGLPVRARLGTGHWVTLTRNDSWLCLTPQTEDDMRMRQIVHTAQEGIWVIDTAGATTFANPVMARMLGCEIEQLLGATMFEFMDAEAQREAERNMERRRQGIVEDHDFRFTKPDGAEVLVSMATNPLLDDHGTFVGALAMVIDVTEVRRTERHRDTLLARVKAKNKELEELVYITSHDLRSPLVNIEGFGKEIEDICVEITGMLRGLETPDAISTRLAELLDEEMPTSLGFIHRSAQKMNRLLQGLLKLSRLGRQPFEPVSVDMNTVVAEVIATAQFQVREAGAAITIDDLPRCYADPAHCSQMLSNLIGNALKYRSPGRPCQITISAEVANDEVTYLVTDNGVGISDKSCSQIFEIFHRVYGAPGEGEGLGLTITRRLAERSGGQISVDSEEGSGSTFRITLPASQVPHPV